MGTRTRTCLDPVAGSGAPTGQFLDPRPTGAKPAGDPPRGCRLPSLLKTHLLNLLDAKKIYWKQRSTIIWVKFGDENTKLFQAIVAQKFRRNFISQLQLADGTIVLDQEHMVATLWNSFKEWLGQTKHGSMIFDLGNLIHPVALAELDEPFHEKEIDELVKELTLDRAPGLTVLMKCSLKGVGPLSRLISTMTGLI
jgi:hypothetical protein